MKKKVINLFDKVSPFFDRLGQNPYIQAISGAMMSTLGITFIGSISVLFLVLFNMSETLKKMTGILILLGKINTFTINSLALFIAILMAYHLVKKLAPKEDAISAAMISLLCFLLITPMGQTSDKINAIPTTWLSAQGIFSAIIVGLISGRLFIAIKKKGWTIKMPAGVPPMVSRVFESLIPTLMISFLFILVDLLFSSTSFGSMHQFVYQIIQQPLKGIGGSIGAMVIMSLIQQILWFFGIHGTNVILPIMTPLWLAMDMENLNAVSEGKFPPNIIGLAFFTTITFGGMALGLILLMLRAKSKQYREVGKISIIPALFGITEPVIFGTPLVLNFSLAIPFITNNAVALILTYVLAKIGIVARFTGIQSIFGLPVGFHAAVQGKVSIVIMQIIIQFILSPILWYPWFKYLDNTTYKNELEAIEKGK